ncbi:hypothetical protein MAR_005552 [Mya arenaria]|uniref:FLYWCH-type domain-containing protein n=1 Tax=Mya arenaria TaxID=6604 RepID=A0ABY7F304_MYAAR|nr:hypothetical protein MAR_005533 [Mya arenaria]WAR15447.1 hypothetical protein MAR_005552 [Mya arenaria]
MELIKNNSGGLKLCLNGYMYTKKNTKKTSIRWECSQKRGLDCLGAVNTDIEVQTVLSSKDHNHEADFDKIEATKAVNVMKNGANISRGRPQQLVVDVLQPLPVEVRAAAGTTNAVKQRIRRQMNKLRPKDPASLQELDLSEDWKHTGEPYRHPFLLHDSGRDSENRILVPETPVCVPIEDVSEGMEFLKQTAPEEIEDVIAYFDKTYVSGTFRRIQQQDGQPIRLRRIQPLYPPTLWNVHQATLTNSDRTNNLCESWNQQFQKLLGYNHPTVWVAIEAFRKDHSVVETALFNNANGVPPKKRVKKSTTELQERLQNLCTDYVDRIKGMEEFLRAVGRTIRWKV